MVKFIINDGVMWGNTLGETTNNMSQNDKLFYEQALKIPDRQTKGGGGLLIPFDNSIADENKFSISYGGFNFDGKDATLIVYKYKDGNRKLVIADIPLATVKILFKSNQIKFP
jgi:hypothetical protein